MSYEKWTPEEDGRLGVLAANGLSVKKLGEHFPDRSSGAIRSRLNLLANFQTAKQEPTVDPRVTGSPDERGRLYRPCPSCGKVKSSIACVTDRRGPGCGKVDTELLEHHDKRGETKRREQPMSDADVLDAEIIQRLSVDEAINAALSGTVDANMIGDAAHRLALEVIRLRPLRS
jgi:hypothetical protein